MISNISDKRAAQPYKPSSKLKMETNTKWKGVKKFKDWRVIECTKKRMQTDGYAAHFEFGKLIRCHISVS